jgi:hypothetical protein
MRKRHVAWRYTRSNGVSIALVEFSARGRFMDKFHGVAMQAARADVE